MQIRRLIQGVLIGFFLATHAAFAYESHFEFNKKYKLDDLIRSGKTEVETVRNDDVFHADASAVLSMVDFAKMFAASADFNHYDEMGMPNVLDSRIVARTGAVLNTWTHMSTMGQVSKHYLEVRLHPVLGPNGSAGSEWQLVHRQGSWTLPDQPAFKRLDGSWYMEPVDGGRIYVRYYLKGVIDTFVPPSLIDLIIRNQFHDGVTKVIQVLARQGAIRP